MTPMGKKHVKLIDQLRQAAGNASISQNALARASGIDKAALSRFVSGERGLAMENLNALADVLDLRIVAGKVKTTTAKTIRKAGKT